MRKSLRLYFRPMTMALFTLLFVVSLPNESFAIQIVAPRTSASTGKEKALVISIRGGDSNGKLAPGVQYEDLIEGAYSWCCNLGAPAALVAGAVIATLYENMKKGDLEVIESDQPMVQFGKKITRLLLLSAFALELFCIFVTIVTGTCLLSRTADAILTSSAVIDTPIELLRENFEFEFLTAQITFLQGLLNWLAAIGLAHILPSSEVTSATISPPEDALNRFIACSLGTLILLMISFFNSHLTFYNNYPSMLIRWCDVTYHRFFGVLSHSPTTPLSLILLPLLLTSFYYGYKALSQIETPLLS